MNNFRDIEKDIKERSEKYSINNSSHKVFVGERFGFKEGVDWTLKKLYQLGYLDFAIIEYCEEKNNKEDKYKLWEILKYYEEGIFENKDNFYNPENDFFLYLDGDYLDIVKEKGVNFNQESLNLYEIKFNSKWQKLKNE